MCLQYDCGGPVCNIQRHPMVINNAVMTLKHPARLYIQGRNMLFDGDVYTHSWQMKPAIFAVFALTQSHFEFYTVCSTNFSTHATFAWYLRLQMQCNPICITFHFPTRIALQINSCSLLTLRFLPNMHVLRCCFPLQQPFSNPPKRQKSSQLASVFLIAKAALFYFFPPSPLAKVLFTAVLKLCQFSELHIKTQKAYKK